MHVTHREDLGGRDFTLTPPACFGILDARSIIFGNHGAPLHPGATATWQTGPWIVAAVQSTGTPPSSSLDLVFIIDTTGSMGPYINNVKVNATSLLNSLTALVPDARVAVLDYKDFPARTGDPYVYRDVQQFTADTTAAKNAINGLSVGGGGDAPEARYARSRTRLRLIDVPGRARQLVSLPGVRIQRPKPSFTSRMPQHLARSRSPGSLGRVSLQPPTPVVSSFLVHLLRRSGF